MDNRMEISESGVLISYGLDELLYGPSRSVLYVHCTCSSLGLFRMSKEQQPAAAATVMDPLFASAVLRRRWTFQC